MTSPTYHEYAAWDVPTRWFHWINALSVIGLIATGLVILNDDALGLSSGGKILLKGIVCCRDNKERRATLKTCRKAA